ncbi:transposase [Actinoallomurus rhizosphaericola]|uniref:transposase n=1 Tax=Actinoallomurus rhizosphaericola TaxID=2952536 RepID=UPI0020916E59|nr:transposase [Actinoallomurus rhizosphaericola]MCO5993197.1 transposase [Actinoallomurus rhizosphaericola]
MRPGRDDSNGDGNGLGRAHPRHGSANLPSKSWTTGSGRVLAAGLAADLDAWTRRLGLHDQADLPDAVPDSLRHWLWRLPARLTRHARRRWLKISVFPAISGGKQSILSEGMTMF